MPITKASSTQVKNEGLPKILQINFDNGTGSRSSSTSTTNVAVPGPVGDTSYTAPADQDVDIYFTHELMVNSTAGYCKVWLSINGVATGKGSYQEVMTSWSTHAITNKVQVAAGATITIGLLWSTSSGTVTTCNASTDLSQGYPVQITGLVIPRPS